MLDADPLSVITGELEHKPELPSISPRRRSPILRPW